ncbi:hypothetical protein JQ625_31785 [Bradyrhizobium diazoefficiens]|nr:hypothetical protein [Bradyrhizobium diazoefficiens]MBR0779424.1 hypothetical protein [Bradyrhizobium diazoefficiens]
MSDDAKDAGLVAMISSILGGGKRTEAVEAAMPAEWIAAAPASQPEPAVSLQPQDAPAAEAAEPAGQPATSQGRRRLPAEAIAELVLGELRKIDNFPASGVSVTVYGYRHWNAMLTFAPFSTTFQNAARIRQAMPDLVFKLRRFVELEI